MTFTATSGGLVRFSGTWFPTHQIPETGSWWAGHRNIHALYRTRSRNCFSKTTELESDGKPGSDFWNVLPRQPSNRRFRPWIVHSEECSGRKLEGLSRWTASPVKGTTFRICLPTENKKVNFFPASLWRLWKCLPGKYEREFLLLSRKAYTKIPSNWIRPLDKDVLSVLDKDRIRLSAWIMHSLAAEGWERSGLGRVAAFVWKRTGEQRQWSADGWDGFFECIQDKSAAFMLFDRCKEWLQAQSMEAMDGPINFGSKDRWWGFW